MDTPELGFAGNHADPMPMNIQLTPMEKLPEQLVGFATNPVD
jgi:hypothetical protein